MLYSLIISVPSAHRWQLSPFLCVSLTFYLFLLSSFTCCNTPSCKVSPAVVLTVSQSQEHHQLNEPQHFMITCSKPLYRVTKRAGKPILRPNTSSSSLSEQKPIKSFPRRAACGTDRMEIGGHLSVSFKVWSKVQRHWQQNMFSLLGASRIVQQGQTGRSYKHIWFSFKVSKEGNDLLVRLQKKTQANKAYTLINIKCNPLLFFIIR